MTQRCKDLVGKDVVLTRDVTTRGGTTHKAGSAFQVSQTWRGRFSLRRDDRPGFSPTQILHLERNAFRLTEPMAAPEEACPADPQPDPPTPLPSTPPDE